MDVGAAFCPGQNQDLYFTEGQSGFSQCHGAAFPLASPAPSFLLWRLKLIRCWDDFIVFCALLQGLEANIVSQRAEFTGSTRSESELEQEKP